MLPGILPHTFQLRTSTERLWLVEVKQQQQAVLNTWKVGAGTASMLQFIQAVISLLSHLGTGKQQVLQPWPSAATISLGLPLASLVLGQMLLRTLASSAGYKHHWSWRRWDTARVQAIFLNSNSCSRFPCPSTFRSWLPVLNTLSPSIIYKWQP